MKWLCCALLLAVGMLHAKDDEWGIELRASYFSPKSKATSRAFANGGFDGEVEISKRFSERWLGWGNVNYFTKNGKSRHSHTKRHVHLTPVSAGVKYLIPCTETFFPYIGIGPSYSFFHTENRHRGGKKHHYHKNGWGAVAKFGAYIDFPRNFFLDIFVDYYMCRMHFSHKKIMNARHADMGGVHFGLGLGYKF